MAVDQQNSAKPKRQIIHPKRTKWGRVPAEITQAELQEQFHLPMETAAHKLGVGLTVLKQICRKFGIARWPFRKVFQLKRLASVAKDFRALVPLIMEVQVPEDSKLWRHFDGKCQEKISKALKAMEEFSHGSTAPSPDILPMSVPGRAYPMPRNGSHVSLQSQLFHRTGSFHSVSSCPSKLSSPSSQDYFSALESFDTDTTSEFMDPDDYMKNETVWNALMNMAMHTVNRTRMTKDYGKCATGKQHLQKLMQCSPKMLAWNPSITDFVLDATDTSIDMLLQNVGHMSLTPSHSKSSMDMDSSNMLHSYMDVPQKQVIAPNPLGMMMHQPTMLGSYLDSMPGYGHYKGSQDLKNSLYAIAEQPSL